MPATFLSPGFVERLLVYPWPLNLRELDMLAQRLAARVSVDRELRTDDLPDDFGRGDSRFDARSPAETGSDGVLSPPPHRLSHRREDRFLRAFPPEELRRLQQLLTQQEGNLTKAAAAMGITRARAYRLLRSVQRHGKRSDTESP